MIRFIIYVYREFTIINYNIGNIQNTSYFTNCKINKKNVSFC